MNASGTSSGIDLVFIMKTFWVILTSRKENPMRKMFVYDDFILKMISVKCFIYFFSPLLRRKSRKETPIEKIFVNFKQRSCHANILGNNVLQ